MARVVKKVKAHLVEVDPIDMTIGSTALLIGGQRTKMSELFGIEQDDLITEYTTQASRYAFVGMQTALAEAAYEEAKGKTELLYARLDREVRVEFSSSDKKLTEVQAKQTIIEDPEYQDSLAKELGALYEWKVLKAIVAAIAQRGDMLINMGAMMRQEYDVTGLQLKETREQQMAKMLKKRINVEE